MSNKANEENSANFPMGRRRILVVGDKGYFSPNIISHSVQLAGRLGFDLVALSVESGWDGPKPHSRSRSSVKEFLKQAAQIGVRCDHITRNGEVGAEVSGTIQKIKRVEFVVIDAGASPESIREVTIPVVSVSSGQTNSIGGKEMSAETSHGRFDKGLIAKTAGYGLLTAAMYAAVFTNSQTVMQYFTRGGVYAALPIATVFIFSFAHGAFAHNLWSLLGIEAMRKDRVRESEKKVVEKRKTLQKRPRMYAYVNPFHRIDK